MAYTDLEIRAFTQIAYADLAEGYDLLVAQNPGKTSFTIKEVRDAARSAGGGGLSSLGCLTDEQLNTWEISGVHDTNNENGFYACIIKTGPNEAAVGFRGSEGMDSLDNVVHDWVQADIGLVNSTCTSQQAEVRDFLEKYSAQLDSFDNLAMAGHSLGGNLAEFATVVSGEYGLSDNIQQCVSMDGPGFSGEFIDKYRKEIESMAGVMYHPRWSFVGTMLNDLPEVKYEYVSVSNKPGRSEYSAVTRHDTAYLDYDENGMLIPGEQDAFSKVTSLVSKGVDLFPTPVGNALVTLVGGAWIGIMWAGENCIDQNGNLTPAGWHVVAGAIGVVTMFGVVTVIKGLIAVVVTVLAVLLIATVAEFLYELALKIVNAIIDGISQVMQWAQSVINEIRELVIQCLDAVKQFFQERFDAGYKYSQANPFIQLNTDTMRAYADRIDKVNARLQNLDNRLSAMYKRVDLWDLLDLQSADMKIGYNSRLKKCAYYLRDTASEFANAEKEILKNA